MIIILFLLVFLLIIAILVIIKLLFILKKQKKEDEILKNDYQNLKEILKNKEKFAMLGEMLGSITHEIKNPLGAILTNIQMIKIDFNQLDKIEEKDKKDMIELVDAIEEATKRAKNIVGDILNYMRKDAKESYKLDIWDTINSIKTLVKKEVEKDNIKFIIESEKDMYIFAKRGEIIQVVLNLILNARDALLEKANNFEKKLVIKGYKKNDKVFIEIIDNGIGIPKNIINNIFEPFYTTKIIDKGTGLGLAIVKEILNRNNAEIYVESELNIGTKFTVKFEGYNAHEKIN